MKNIWSNLFGRGRQNRELDEEIQAHFAMAVRDRVERGEDAREAELAVRREFGNQTLVRETTRDIWGWRLFHEALQDIRYALRGMRNNLGLTVSVVATLALGIGANTAIFSIVYSVMLRALPVEHPEQLVELLQKYPGEPRGNGYWTSASYRHYRDSNHVFSALTGAAIDNVVPVRINGADRETVIGEYVLENYFPVFGLQPSLGRLIGPEHDSGKPEGEVAVVSWNLWNSRFQRDSSILGKQIVVNDAPFTIIGVAPRGYYGLRSNAQADLWLPAKPNMGLALIARLQTGTSLQQARAEMESLYRFTIEERAARSTDPQVRQLRVELEPARAGLASVRDMVGQPLSVLMAIVAVLLLLACVNVAGLLLARGAGREREMSLRLSLGASRGRLMRQVLTESLLLSALGTLAGSAVAYSGTAILLQILDSGRPHERVHLMVRPDLNLLLFGAAVTLLAGLLFGLAPAGSAFRTDSSAALRQSGSGAETWMRRLLGKSLVAAQVALSMLLLSCGAMFIERLASLKSADLGFRRDHVLLVTLDPSRSGYANARLAGLYRELLDRMQSIPGVRSASLGAPTPLHGAGASGFGTAEGFDERPEDKRWISIAWVAPKYFEALGTPLLAGRDFTFQDSSSPQVAILNQTLAKYYFAGRDPIGKRITLDHVTMTREPATYEIVGVVGDANYREIRESERRGIYLPAFRNDRVTAGTFILRTGVEPTSIGGEVQRIVRQSTGGAIPISKLTTLSDQIDSSIVPERLMATLSGFFAALGALLAGIGVYGLLAYTVTRRTNEIGIRVAMGATPVRLLRMVLLEALAIVAVGLACGIPLAMWAKTVAATLAPDLRGSAAISSFVLAGVGILAVAFLASSIPARRAALVDPLEALRHE